MTFKFIENKFFAFFIAMLAIMTAPMKSHAAWQQPPEFFGSADTARFALASDDTGHAIYLAANDNIINAFRYNPITLSWDNIGTFDAIDTVKSIDVAMDGSGTALAAWTNNGDIGTTAYFNGTNWFTSSMPFPAGTFAFNVSVALRSATEGVLLWILDDTVDLLATASFFSNGLWGLPTLLDIGTADTTDVAYSINGTVIAGWNNTNLNTVNVASFVGGVWSFPEVLDPAGFFEEVAISATGRGVAIWHSVPDGDVRSSTFGGTSWSPFVNIALAQSFPDPRVSMAPNGTAVAVWRGPGCEGFSSVFNGSVWSLPILFTNDVLDDTQNPVDVSLNKKGTALVVWADQNDVIKSAFMPFGGSWGSQETIQFFPPDDFEATLIRASLSANGAGFAGWQDNPEEEGAQQLYGSATIAPTPPLAIFGETCKNRFAMQSVCVNVITWVPSIDPSVVAYYLSKNGVVIEMVPSTGPFTFTDPVSCRGRGDVYSVVSVNINGSESLPVVVVVN